MRGGDGLSQVDLALNDYFEILRLDLHALQAAHAFVDDHLAREIAQPDLGQAQALGQQRIAGDDELRLAVTHGAGRACPGQVALGLGWPLLGQAQVQLQIELSGQRQVDGVLYPRQLC